MPFETDPDFENRMEEYFGSLVDASKTMAELQADNKALRAWKAEAMEVLRPFAETALDMDTRPGGYPWRDGQHLTRGIRAGNLRAARRLVEKEDGR